MTAENSDRFAKILTRWATECPRFRSFVERNQQKIDRKFRHSETAEDKFDVLTELDTVRRFLALDHFDVEYEPYGKKGADLRVSREGTSFDAEVKRIREVAAMERYSHCIGKLVETARQIPSAMGVQFSCFVDAGPEFAFTVEQHLDSLVRECDALIRDCSLSDGKSQSYCFEAVPELRITISHVPEKAADTPTANFGGVTPILFTQNESFKFTDLVLGCFRQFTSNFGNVLIVHCHSTTHWAKELPMAICEIDRLAQEGDEEFFRKKKLEGIADYLKKLTLLSAVVVVTGRGRVPAVNPQNLVWLNPKSAKPLDKVTTDALQQM